MDKVALKEAKKAARKEERVAKREAEEKNATPAGPPDSMVDAELFLSAHGVPAGLPRLHVHFDGKELHASSSVFCTTKAAHRFLMNEPDADWQLTSEACTLIMARPIPSINNKLFPACLACAARHRCGSLHSEAFITPATEHSDPTAPALQFDPDAPEREADASMPGKRGPWLHWMVTNATVSALGATRSADKALAPHDDTAGC